MNSSGVKFLLLVTFSSPFFFGSAARNTVIDDEIVDTSRIAAKEKFLRWIAPSRIRFCALKQENKDAVNNILAANDRTDQPGQLGDNWYIPTDPNQGGGEILPLNQPVPALGGLLEAFEWFASVIPVAFNETRSGAGLPPGFDPSNPFANQLPPFLNFQSNPASWGHNKWPAFPYWIMAHVRFNVDTYQSTDQRNTIFLKNLKDRGPNNLLKKQYLSALTCDKLPLYKEKVETMVNGLVEDIKADPLKPLMSTWYDRVIKFYLDIHFGKADHPDFVLDWVQAFLTQFSDEPNVKEDVALANYCRVPSVDDYFDLRLQRIVATSDKSTLIYWWVKAGIPRESVIFEAAHNALAFSQFVNMLFLVVRAKTDGYTKVNNLGPNGITRETIDFFDKHKNTDANGEQKLDVAREAYRLLLPTSFMFSSVATEEGEINDGKFISDPTFNDKDSLIILLLVQVINDNYNPSRLTTEAGIYNTSRYDDFQPVECPMMSEGMSIEDMFMFAEEDGETVVPKSHKEYFPVFEAGSKTEVPINGPKYCPFGLGYRRCPGELLNYFILENILEALADFEFKFVPDATSTDPFDEPVPTDADFDEAVNAFLGRVPDKYFVIQN